MAAGVILAAGIFLLLRHKHRHTETASNLAPLSHGSTGYSTSDRSSVVGPVCDSHIASCWQSLQAWSMKIAQKAPSCRPPAK